jgi:hypothetical protein
MVSILFLILGFPDSILGQVILTEVLVFSPVPPGKSGIGC